MRSVAVRNTLRFLGIIAAAALGTACTTVQRLPPGVPPSPTSVTRDEPGGNAANPEVAALDRLTKEPWGARSDRDAAVLVGLADAPNWRRVKFFMIDTLAGFRYGDDHHAIAAVFLRDAPKEGATTETCLRDFEKWAMPTAKGFGVATSEPRDVVERWRGRDLIVRKREGSVHWGFSKKSWATAYAAYAPWRESCLVLAYAVPTNEDGDLASKVRDRFAEQAFTRFFVRGTERPSASSK